MVKYLGITLRERYPRDDWIKESLDDVGWINPCPLSIVINSYLNGRGNCLEMAVLMMSEHKHINSQLTGDQALFLCPVSLILV